MDSNPRPSACSIMPHPFKIIQSSLSKNVLFLKFEMEYKGERIYHGLYISFISFVYLRMFIIYWYNISATVIQHEEEER
jgi:hypothetical protein